GDAQHAGSMDGGFAEFTSVVVGGRLVVRGLRIAKHGADDVAVVEDQGELEARDVVFRIEEVRARTIVGAAFIVPAIIAKHIERDMMRAEGSAAVILPGGLTLMIGIRVGIDAVVVDGHAGGIGEDAGADFIHVDVHLAGHGVDVGKGVDLVARGHFGFDAAQDLGGRIVAAATATAYRSADQLKLLVGHAGIGLLVKGRAIAGAATGHVQHQSTVTVDKFVITAADADGDPLVVLRRAKIPLDDFCARRRGRAFDGHDFAAVKIDNLVVTAVGCDQLPDVVSGGAERIKNDIRAVGQGGEMDGGVAAAVAVIDLVPAAEAGRVDGEFLVGAAVGTPLVQLRALGGAVSGNFHDQAALEVEERIGTVAVLHRFPLVIPAGAEGP